MKKMSEVLQAGTVHSFYISEESCYIKYCCVKCDCTKCYMQKPYILCRFITSYLPYLSSLKYASPFVYPLPLHLLHLGRHSIRSAILDFQLEESLAGSFWRGAFGGELLAGSFWRGVFGGPIFTMSRWREVAGFIVGEFLAQPFI